MKKPTVRLITAITGATLLAASLAACTSDDAGGVDPDAPVTITIGDFPSSDQTERVAFVTQQIEDFEAEYPNITIETDTAQYSPDTFAAELAGGTLPDVLAIPFTEPQGLIRNGQASNLTPALEELGILDDLNPTVLATVSDENGDVYALPDWTYAVGLGYNREIFEQAGLDPDAPPTTWDEVRAAAKQITDATGIPGFGMMASGNGGGWSLTALTYGFGGTIENADGTAGTIDEGPTAAVLETLRGMQEDGSFHNNLLLDFSGNTWQEFAGGKFAMTLATPNEYQATVTNNGMAPEAYGVTIMPSGLGGNGTLSGGAAKFVKAGLTPEEVLAAVKWINFSNFEPQLDEAAAVADAEAKAADGLPVGIPGVSVFNQEVAGQVQGWIAPYVNVPTDNFAPWVEGVSGQTLVPEPPAKAQDVYRLLDVLVQTVLSDPSSDIDALVADYNQQLTDLLGR